MIGHWLTDTATIFQSIASITTAIMNRVIAGGRHPLRKAAINRKIVRWFVLMANGLNM